MIRAAAGLAVEDVPLEEQLRAPVCEEAAAARFDAHHGPQLGKADVEQDAGAHPFGLARSGKGDDRDPGSADTNDQHDTAEQVVLSIPWTKRAATRYREILIPNRGKRCDLRPIRADTRNKLVRAIARGRLWLLEIQSGAVANVQDIAAREKCSKRHVNMTLSLAFLAPSLVKAAVEGRLPHGIGVARMLELPPGWARQYEILGLVPPALGEMGAEPGSV